MESRLLLYVTGSRRVTTVEVAWRRKYSLIGKGAAVLELLSGEDQSLLVRGNARRRIGEQLTTGNRGEPYPSLS